MGNTDGSKRKNAAEVFFFGVCYNANVHYIISMCSQGMLTNFLTGQNITEEKIETTKIISFSVNPRQPAMYRAGALVVITELVYGNAIIIRLN